MDAKRIAFIKPNYPNERRVALLPEDLGDTVYDQVLIEAGFGEEVGIPDESYRSRGAIIAGREECFSVANLFSLKLIQPSDYHLLKHGQKIIGWTHPYGSGRTFYEEVAKPKALILVDLDSASPRFFHGDSVSPIHGLPKHFFWENSYVAGEASVRLGVRALGIEKNIGHMQVCVLGSGHCSQGAFSELVRLGGRPRMFNRKNMDIFRELKGCYDLIVNGVEMDVNEHLISYDDMALLKKGCLIIDAAADAGGAIEGTDYQTFDSPVGVVRGISYSLVNNAPSYMHEQASKVISKVVSSVVLGRLYEVGSNE